LEVLLVFLRPLAQCSFPVARAGNIFCDTPPT
jgi:hypothetical protein